MSMENDRTMIEKIRNLLYDPAVQQHIRENIERTQQEARVTIGRAAELFSISEAKLREWERIGLLKPVRSKEKTGQRQYSLADLRKLAVIYELVEHNYSISEIPANVDELWEEVAGIEEREMTAFQDVQEKPVSIDQRIEGAYEQDFWRYYASHVLQLALTLIFEDTPFSIAGLILPLQQKGHALRSLDSELVTTLGPSLVCWRSAPQTFHVFYTLIPSFSFPSDFRVSGLIAEGEDEPQDSTYVVIQRAMPKITLNIHTIQTIRRLIAPLYEDTTKRSTYFGYGIHDMIYIRRDFNLPGTETVLHKLTDMVVQVGGRTSGGISRWRFCYLLLAEQSSRTSQQSSLVIQAKSKESPHYVGLPIYAQGASISLSIRAFLSGRIAYRPFIPLGASDAAMDSTMITLWQSEGRIASAIAIPLGGEDGQPIGVMYVGSDFVDAFSEDDQRLLRCLGKVIEERMRILDTRAMLEETFAAAVSKPQIVDSLFETFLSDEDFRSDVDAIIKEVQSIAANIFVNDKDKRNKLRVKNAVEDYFTINNLLDSSVSFISIDADQQDIMASRYGNLAMRNLSHKIGMDIKEQLRAYTIEHIDCQLYHIDSDKFYIILKEVDLKRAGEIAEKLRIGLARTHKIDALQTYPGPPSSSNSLLEVPNVTVRLGVSSYFRSKLVEILLRNPLYASEELKAVIILGLDESLKRAKDDGGNTVFAWDPQVHNFTRLSPPKQ